MMRRARGLILAIAVPALVAGCGLGDMIAGGKPVEYKSAGRLPPLEVPPDLTRPGRDDRYAVPDVSPTGTATFSAYNAERGGGPRIPRRSGHRDEWNERSAVVAQARPRGGRHAGSP